VQQNDPAPIQNNPNALAPFSAPRAVYPTNLASQITLNTTGFVGYRPAYFVTRDAGGNTVPAYLQPFLGDGYSPNGFICTTPAQNIVSQHAFGILPGHTASICGVA
jgi:hypothetical protein